MLTKNPSLLWLQYRINHRILGINNLLFKMNKKDSDLCDFCKTSPETISHIFWHCPISQTLIKEVEKWINDKLDLNLSLNIADTILGINQNIRYNKLINLILLLLKNTFFLQK